MQPTWATHYNDPVNHFYIPPHWGRGNHHDAWTPVCGAAKHIMPWMERIEDYEKPRCQNCSKIISVGEEMNQVGANNLRSGAIR